MAQLLPLVLLGITVAPLVANGHLGWAIIATAFGLLLIMLFTIIFVKEAPVRNRIETPLKHEMLRVLGMLTGIVFGGLAGVLVGAITGGIIGIGVMFFSGKSIGLEAGVFVGGAVAMVSAIIVGVLIGARATLGDQVRIYPRFVWWIINRLMFLAAITSIQGFAPYFLMYAFKVSSETAAGMTGTLVTVVGICTLISALPAGWLADRFGVTRLISLSGILGALGTVILLTSVWAPSLPIIYIAGLILGLSTGLFVTTNWALGTMLAPDEKAGLFLGVSNLAGAGAGMIGSGIGGPIADFLNSSQHGLGYFAIFSSYALLFMLSSLVLRKVK